MNKKNYFQGKDRLEFVEELQRPIRMGNPKELKESDYDNIIKFIKTENWEEAKNRLQLLNPLHIGMNTTFLEWIIALPNILKQKKNTNKNNRKNLSRNIQHLAKRNL